MDSVMDDCILLQPGSPIRTSAAIALVCSLPQLFAAYHVLRRLPVPRHPPYALIHLTSSESPSVSNADGLSLKISSMKNLYWFSRCIIIVVVTQTLNLKSLLGDNFLISFQFDTFFFRIVQFSRYKMVETRGIEPLTSCVQGRRSPS